MAYPYAQQMPGNPYYQTLLQQQYQLAQQQQQQLMQDCCGQMYGCGCAA